MEKGQPPRGLLLVCSTFQSRQVARDGWLGDLEAECQQLAMDLRCAPTWIVGLHSADESPDLVIDFGRPSGRERRRQNRRKPARCHETTVSAFTMIKAPAQPDHHCRSEVAQLVSAKIKSGVRPPPSPGSIHCATRRAQLMKMQSRKTTIRTTNEDVDCPAPGVPRTESRQRQIGLVFLDLASHHLVSRRSAEPDGQVEFDYN